MAILFGGIKAKVRRKGYAEAQRAAVKRVARTIAGHVKYVTIQLLANGLVWCVYYLLLAVCVPGQADYANTMAELIVAVPTVISIIFAFVEFKPARKIIVMSMGDSKGRGSGPYFKSARGTRISVQRSVSLPKEEPYRPVVPPYTLELKKAAIV